MRLNDAVYFEAALLIGLLGFVGTVALARYLMRGDINTERHETWHHIEALLKADDSEPVQQWFGRWRQTLIWEKDYDDGKWVELTF